MVTPGPDQLKAVKQSLSLFTPLEEHFIAADYRDKGPHEPISFPKDDDVAELQRIHSFFCPLCFARLVKGCGVGEFEAHARIPVLTEENGS